MAKLFFNTRDEMFGIDTDLIALVKADGNYSVIVYITGKEIHLPYGISKMEAILKENNDKRNRFVRVGRSVIINHFFVYKIQPIKQIMMLSDGGKENISIVLPKQTLKAYKDAIYKSADIGAKTSKNKKNNIKKTI